MKRIIVKIIAFFISLLCLAATWFYFTFWVPNKILLNSNFWKNNYQVDQVNRKKIRKASETLLWFWGGWHPSALIILENVGDKDSIPCLIWSLKWQNKRWQKEIAAGQTGLTCTSHMCALDTLTGMERELGDDHKAWEKWWKETGRYLPFDEEKGQLVTGRNSRRNQSIIDSRKQE